MKLPDEAHTSRPWRIHELAGDFRLEDVGDLFCLDGQGSGIGSRVTTLRERLPDDLRATAGPVFASLPFKPFRYLIVYPQMLRAMERRWQERPDRASLA
jgi:hypothetical protein